MFFFSSRRRHTRCLSDWSSDVCSSDLRSTRRRAAERRLVDRPRAMLGHDVADRVAVRQIGRASCRKECRARWSPYDEKKNGLIEVWKEYDQAGIRHSVVGAADVGMAHE